MIKKVFIISAFLSVLICAVTYFLFYFQSSTNHSIKTSLLQNGDLILRCGRSTESFAVFTADKDAEFTHIGIVVIENKIPKIIHAVPHKNKFLKKESIEEFLKPENASKFAIYRSNFSSTTLQKVTSEISTFYKNKIVFDNNYDLETDHEMYCTELILKAFKNSNIPLNIKTKELNYLFGNHVIIFPSEFTKSPFKKVKIN